jgi:hypothetical protein
VTNLPFLDFEVCKSFGAMTSIHLNGSHSSKKFLGGSTRKLLLNTHSTQLGFGLVHAFDLLKRKGLQSPTVEGTFHHHLKEGLLHISEARFRDLWCVIGKVNKLADLRSRTPEQLYALAIKIVDDHASTATLQKMAANKLRKDELLYQSTQMACDLLDYMNFDAAIKTGNVGTLQDLLPHLLFRFIGSKNKNYAIEILDLLQGLHREWPPDLK